MKLLVLFISLILGSTGIAQTKLIAFKSHAGNMKDFYELVKLRDVDMMPHNLGAAPEKIVQVAELDSVIYIDDTTTIMITSRYCHDEYQPSAPEWLWMPGKDTIINNEVWNQDNPDAIKNDLKSDFNFRNKIDSVVFIGFPEKETEEPIDHDREAGGGEDKEKEEEVPTVIKNTKPGFGIPVTILTLSILSIIIALISWRRSHFKGSELA